MKKAVMRILSIVLIAALLSLPMTALADQEAQGSWKVQVNGEYVDMPAGKTPFYDEENYSVYVPFRALFETLGATVGYDAATRTVSAVLGDMTVSFKQDGVITIDVEYTDDESFSFDLNCPAVTISDSVYVPYYILNYTTDLRVGYDYYEQALIIIDTATLLEGRTGEYTIFEKLLKMEAATGNYEGKAVINFDMKSTADSDMGEFSLPIDAEINVVTSGMAADMSFSASGDLSSVMSTLIPGITANMKIDGELLMDLEKGLFALKCDTLAALIDPEIEPGTWLTLDMAELGIDFDAIIDAAGQVADIDTIIDYMYQSVLSSQYISSIDDYDALKLSLDMIDGMFSDSSFVKTGNNYVSTTEFTEYDTDMTYIFTIKTDSAGNAVGCTIKCDIEDDYMSMSMSVDATALSAKMDLTMEVEGISIKMNLDMTNTATTKAPRTSIPAGAKTVDINDLMY